MTHATPAATYAHVADRDWECDGAISQEDKERCPHVLDIARQLVEEEPGMSINVSVSKRADLATLITHTVLAVSVAEISHKRIATGKAAICFHFGRVAVCRPVTSPCRED